MNDILEMIFGFYKDDCLAGCLLKRTGSAQPAADIAGCFWGKLVAVKCSDIDCIILGSPLGS